MFIQVTKIRFVTDGDLDNQVMDGTGIGMGCHFSGECKTREDCRSACAALGLNPDAVKCVTKPNPNPSPAAAAAGDGGKHCCCFN